jgi:hypothetical protein
MPDRVSATSYTEVSDVRAEDPGRTVLYPADDNVSAAVQTAVSMVR